MTVAVIIAIVCAGGWMRCAYGRRKSEADAFDRGMRYATKQERTASMLGES